MPVFEGMTVQQIAQLKADCGCNDMHISHDLRKYYGCSQDLADCVIAMIKR